LTCVPLARQSEDALSQGPRTLRITTTARIAGIAGIILYGVAGIALGLEQQAASLPPEQVDCAYRVHLLRDRVVALTERSAHFAAADPQDDVLSNLIRETLQVCARRDPERVPALEDLAVRLREHLELRAIEAQARRELLAL
jgi:hypothetical protein